LPPISIPQTQTGHCWTTSACHFSRLGHTEERPTWQQVCEHFLLQLCDGVLETEAFDAV
jgi:hypothetical protein